MALHRCSVLLLLLQLLLLLLLCCAAASASLRLVASVPKDKVFNTYKFAYIRINDWSSIESITSQHGSLFHLDKGSASGQSFDRVAFNGSITAGDYQLVMTGIKAAQLQNVTVNMTVRLVDPNKLYRSLYMKGPESQLSKFVQQLSSASADGVTVNVMAFTGSLACVMLHNGSDGNELTLSDMWKRASEVKSSSASQFSDIELLPDLCSTAKSLCRTQVMLVNDAVTMSSATLTSDSDVTNYIALNAELKGATGSQLYMYSNDCNKTGCLYGAKCTSTGCQCQPEDNQEAGPRCEGTVRSFKNLAQSDRFTTHWIGPVAVSQSQLSISFELAGSVDETLNVPLLTIIANSGSSPLLTVAQNRNTTMIIGGTLMSSKSLEIAGFAGVQSNDWTQVTLFMTADSPVTALLCHHKTGSIDASDRLQCVTAQSGTPVQASELAKVRNGMINLGAAFFGCIRAVRVNGEIIDIRQTVASSSSAVGVTDTKCSQQSSSCTGSGASSYYCGKASICYGTISNLPVSPKCNCHCHSASKRKTEFISDNCLLPYTAADVCSADGMKILNFASPSLAPSATPEASWNLNSSSSAPAIPSLSSNSFQLSFEIRTRQSQALQLMRATVATTSAAGNLVFNLQLSNSSLSLCISTSKCYSFPEMSISDGSWHTVKASAQLRMLSLRLDSAERLDLMDAAVQDVRAAMLSASIDKSCVRNIRLSQVYMPLDDGVVRQSPSSTDFVQLQLGAGSTAAQSCTDPAAACNCPSGQVCNAQWGLNTCQCPPDHVIDPGNAQSCVRANPCVQHSITCPAGGTCTQAAAPPWFVCTAGSVPSTDAPLTPGESGVAWLPFVIAAAALLLLLPLLLLLLFVLCRKRRQQKQDEKLYDDIDRIRMDLAREDPDEGAPPEDYKGELPLNFPPEVPKDRVVPVTMPPPAVPSSDLESPKTSPYNFDETLNYGYEDDEDDENDELDAISLVSLDTDSELDIAEDLKSWGPQFKALSDLLA